MNREALIGKLDNAIADAADELHISQVHLVRAYVLTAITEAGMVVVPREPTNAMLLAGMVAGYDPQDVQIDTHFGGEGVSSGISFFPKRAYKAMLAAAEKGEAE